MTENRALCGEKVYRVANEPRTLSEKLNECYDYIDEAAEHVGMDYIADLKRRIGEGVMDVLETHFSISTLEIEMGNVQIKSNNMVKDTSISIHGTPVSVSHIEWEMDAEDMFGKLRLTFRYP